MKTKFRYPGCWNRILRFSELGYTETTIKINQPPTSGSCSIQAYDNIKDVWYQTNAGTALVQKFKLTCNDKWVDPDQHRIVKYVFKMQKLLVGKMSNFILASGPLAEIEAVFPLGSYKIAAEIHDEANAFTEFIVIGNVEF